MSDEARAWAKRQAVRSIAAKSVLNALAGYADADGQAWPKLRTLAEITGMSERHVRRQLELLERANLLERTEQFRQSGGNTSNLYTLAMPTSELVGADRPDACVRPLSAPGGQSCPTLRTSLESSSSDELSGACARDQVVSVAEAAMQQGLAGERVAVPPEIRADVVASPQLGEGWARSWLDPCAFNAATREIHARSELARGRIAEALRPYLQGWGVSIGAPVPLGSR